VSLIGVYTWNRKKSKLGFNGAKPSIGIKGLLNFAEYRRLSTEEILVGSYLRIRIITTSS
jgi:hypothetical protein